MLHAHLLESGSVFTQKNTFTFTVLVPRLGDAGRTGPWTGKLMVGQETSRLNGTAQWWWELTFTGHLAYVRSGSKCSFHPSKVPVWWGWWGWWRGWWLSAFTEEETKVQKGEITGLRHTSRKKQSRIQTKAVLEWGESILPEDTCIEPWYQEAN